MGRILIQPGRESISAITLHGTGLQLPVLGRWPAGNPDEVTGSLADWVSMLARLTVATFKAIRTDRGCGEPKDGQ